MTAFYIAPYEPLKWKTTKSNLKIDPSWYEQQLSEAWPGIQFLPSSKWAALSWDLLVSEDGGCIFGMLHKDLQVVSLDAPYEEFFLWHRSIIPSEFRLYLFNDSSLESFVELTPFTDMNDLRKFCGNSPAR